MGEAYSCLSFAGNCSGLASKAEGEASEERIEAGEQSCAYPSEAEASLGLLAAQEPIGSPLAGPLQAKQPKAG